MMTRSAQGCGVARAGLQGVRQGQAVIQTSVSSDEADSVGSNAKPQNACGSFLAPESNGRKQKVRLRNH